MSDSADGSANDSQKASGDDVNKSKEDKVAYETYKRAIGDLKATQAKLKELEASKTLEQENKLKEQNDWKSYAEQKEKTLKETTAKLTELETTILDSVKINAFQRQLGGKIKNDAYYQFVDTDKIVYNPETKRVDEESVKNVVADFVKKHSSLVEFKAGKMPNESGTGAKIGGKNVSEMTTAEIEDAIRKMK